jgi:sulfur-carrier protein
MELKTDCKMKILAFGKIAEVLQKEELEVSGPTDTVSLRQKLENDYPALRGMDFQMAVDKKIASGKSMLETGAEVALLPPFSGG